MFKLRISFNTKYNIQICYKHVILNWNEVTWYAYKKQLFDKKNNYFSKLFLQTMWYGSNNALYRFLIKYIIIVNYTLCGKNIWSWWWGSTYIRFPEKKTMFSIYNYKIILIMRVLLFFAMTEDIVFYTISWITLLCTQIEIMLLSKFWNIRT